MSKRTTFTTVSPLPSGVGRQAVLDFLHSPEEMIDLNPLVKERHQIPPPPHAHPEEMDCVWYSITDKISYIPGGLVKGDLTYTCTFHNLPRGLQTHCYAPAGLDIREKWTLNGSLPGEPVEPVELGIGAPLTGLYIREDVDMRCNVMLTSFVKKTLKKSHAALVEHLTARVQTLAAAADDASKPGSQPSHHKSALSMSIDKPLPWIPSAPGPDPRRSLASVYSPFPPAPAGDMTSPSSASAPFIHPQQPIQQAQHNRPLPKLPDSQSHYFSATPTSVSQFYTRSRPPSHYPGDSVYWNKDPHVAPLASRTSTDTDVKIRGVHGSHIRPDGHQLP